MSAGTTVVPVLAPERGRRSEVFRRIRGWLTFLFIVALLAGGSIALYRYRESLNVTSYPSAPARQGDFLVIIRCPGELRAERLVAVYAPRVPDLRIAWLAPAGEPVKKDASIVRFDSSTAQQQLQQ